MVLSLGSPQFHSLSSTDIESVRSVTLNRTRQTAFAKQRSLNKATIIIPNLAPDSPSSRPPGRPAIHLPFAKLFRRRRVQPTPLVRRSHSCLPVPATLPCRIVTIFLGSFGKPTSPSDRFPTMKTRGEPTFGLRGRTIKIRGRVSPTIPPRAIYLFGRKGRARPPLCLWSAILFSQPFPASFARKATIHK